MGRPIHALGCRAACLVFLLAAAACASVAPPLSVAVARAKFSYEQVCPLPRVEAHVVVEGPPPPAPIARDPERLGMWQARALHNVESAATMSVTVRGCGERVQYACMEFPGSAARRRDGEAPSVEPSCLAQEPEGRAPHAE